MSSWSDARRTSFDDPWRIPPRPPGAATLRQSARARLTIDVDADAAFGFLIFLAMLFAAQLGTIGAAILLALIPTYAIVQRRRLWGVLAPRAFLLAAPALALLSVLWSEAPGPSAKLGLEYAATVVAALLLSGAKNPHAVLRGLFCAFVPYLAVSLALGHTTAVGNEGGEAFSGLTNGKNLLGDIAASGVLIALGVAATSVQRKRWIWALAGVAGAGVGVYALVISRSAGGLMGLVFELAGLFGLMSVLRTRVPLRSVLFGFLGLCLTLGMIFHRWLATSLMQLGADLFDKDATLTGRTYLWYRAQDLIDGAPVVGRGFHAFWLQGNIDAEGLWRYAGITSRGGFTFHNTLVEVLVQLGWVGAVGLVLAAAVAVWMLVVRCVRGPTVSLCVWTGVLFYELVRMPIETIGLAPLYFSTMLTFMALGFAIGRPIEGRAPARSRPPPGELRVVAVRVLEPPVPDGRRLLAPPANQP